MRLPLRVAETIRSRKLIAPHDHVLVALSGGPDSVALLRCLIELAAKRDLAFRISAAHLNHGIRGKHADADERFCTKICERLKIPLVRAHAKTPALAKEIKRSLEESARIVRHAFLADAAAQLTCGVVAVGHHADDRIETVLFRLCRGTGIAGLQGMSWTGPLRLNGEPPVEHWIAWREATGSSDAPQSSTLPVPHVVRPLLACSRAEVLAYLKSKRQRFCTDETNFDTGIPRNALRNVVLPALEKKVHAGARAALWRLAEEAQFAADAQAWRRDWLSAFANCQAGTLTLPAPDHLPLPALNEIADALEVLRIAWKLENANFSIRHSQAVQKLFQPRSGPKELHLPANVTAERRGKFVTLRHANPKSTSGDQSLRA
jgi:tRNA(Ile)-lysidine synthetase-like protein